MKVAQQEGCAKGDGGERRQRPESCERAEGKGPRRVSSWYASTAPAKRERAWCTFTCSTAATSDSAASLCPSTPPCPPPRPSRKLGTSSIHHDTLRKDNSRAFPPASPSVYIYIAHHVAAGRRTRRGGTGQLQLPVAPEERINGVVQLLLHVRPAVQRQQRPN